MLCREFEQSMVVVGHHEDLYGMPPTFDAYLSDVRAALDSVGIPTTSGRKMALALSGHLWHASCTMEVQETLLRTTSKLFTTVALQLPLSTAMSLRHIVGRNIDPLHLYWYDDEAYLSEDVVDVQASMVGLMPVIPSFAGVAGDAPADARDSMSSSNREIYKSTVRTVAIEFQRLCHLNAGFATDSPFARARASNTREDVARRLAKFRLIEQDTGAPSAGSTDAFAPELCALDGVDQEFVVSPPGLTKTCAESPWARCLVPGEPVDRADEKGHRVPKWRSSWNPAVPESSKFQSLVRCCKGNHSRTPARPTRSQWGTELHRNVPDGAIVPKLGSRAEERERERERTPTPTPAPVAIVSRPSTTATTTRATWRAAPVQRPAC